MSDSDISNYSSDSSDTSSMLMATRRRAPQGKPNNDGSGAIKMASKKRKRELSSGEEYSSSSSSGGSSSSGSDTILLQPQRRPRPKNQVTDTGANRKAPKPAAAETNKAHKTSATKPAAKKRRKSDKGTASKKNHHKGKVPRPTTKKNAGPPPSGWSSLTKTQQRFLIKLNSSIKQMSAKEMAMVKAHRNVVDAYQDVVSHLGVKLPKPRQRAKTRPILPPVVVADF